MSESERLVKRGHFSWKKNKEVTLDLLKYSIWFQRKNIRGT